MTDRAGALRAFAILREDLAVGWRVDAARQLLTIGAAHHMRRSLCEARAWYARAVAALETLHAEGRASLAPSG